MPSSPISTTKGPCSPQAFIPTLMPNSSTSRTYFHIDYSSMASLFCNVSPAGIPHGRAAAKPRRMVAVRAEAINPDIRKTEDKVVDSVAVAELAKPVTAYCRCWRSDTFPLCDGSHAKHNKATGDNVGPLLLKKQYNN